MNDKSIEIGKSINRFENLLELAKKNNGYIDPTLYESEIETILYSLKIAERNEQINVFVKKLNWNLERMMHMGSVDHKPTQNERILKYIEKFGSITQFEALQDLGILRLASRICDLRRLGYPITSEMVTVKNRFEEDCHVKRYRMATKEV